MYKKVLTSALLLASVFNNNNTHAQPKGKGKASTRFYVTGAADFQSNGYDVDTKTQQEGITVGENPPQDGLLRCKDNVGGRVGIEMVRYTKYKLFIAAGFDFRVVPQKVSLVYNANENGFANSSYTMNEEYSFVNYSMDWKFRLGMAIPMPGKRNALDIAIGPVFNIPLSGKDNGWGSAVYAQTDENSPYKSLIMYQQIGWGSRKYKDNETTLFPLNLLANIQLGYRFLPSTFLPRKNFRVGIDFNARLVGNYNNHIEITTFDANRKSRGTQKFDDAMITLGLFAALEL
ncbi:MAG TPA: hypothetical protein VK167_05720 [Flavipsychrobacter sp.]|nr:hypothetical protein [Flavipsychrobacter sp.]